MNKLYFKNDGYFDRLAMMTLGVNVKKDEDTIGYFGTGFKYAVAIILRLGGKISVSTKNPDGEIELITFTKVTRNIRGEDFDLIQMNGQEISITTRYGINWKPWQAYRELYSNCIDEGGVVSESPGDFDTMVTVECNEIYESWLDRSKYFLDAEPIYTENGVEIYAGHKPHFYYQRIAVANMKEAGSIYSYNITKSIALTEDRTAANPDNITSRIESVFRRMKNKDLLESVIGAPDKTFERGIEFCQYNEPSQEFMEVATRLKGRGRGVNDSVRGLIKKYMQRNGEYEGMPLSPVNQEMMSRAKAFLLRLGVTVDDYEVLCVKGMGEGVFGRALKGKIYLSEIPFQMGTKQVASTLMEEWVHLEKDCDDFSREMQNWLFDKILSIGEQIDGEPL